MNVASLKLCKELYELSGWESDAFRDGETPDYDLGYLMRHMVNNNYDVRVRYSATNKNWRASLIHWGGEQYADTPEDAAAKLAIKLLQHGILTKQVNAANK
jgi:hypothetical protein